jgi:hypothetical protein
MDKKELESLYRRIEDVQATLDWLIDGLHGAGKINNSQPRPVVVKIVSPLKMSVRKMLEPETEEPVKRKRGRPRKKQAC